MLEEGQREEKEGAMRRRASASNVVGSNSPKKKTNLLKWRSDDSKTWWRESEHVLALKLERDVFSSAQVVFLSKVRKQSGLEQILVVTKSQPDKDELTLHVLALKGWSIRLSASLRSLEVIDGGSGPSTTTARDKGGEESHPIKLDFENGTSVSCIVRSFGEKCVVMFSLMQLCDRFFNHVPSMRNISLSELKMVATGEKYTQRCSLLAPSLARRKFSSDASTSDEDGVDDEEDYDENDMDNRRSRTSSIADDMDLATKPKLKRSNTGAESRDNNSGTNKTNTELLNESEQEELWSILMSENLVDMSAGELTKELERRISALEEETGDVLRSWEDRGEQEQHSDPITVLINQLEVVHNQLDEMDSWMANYNIELKTMRKDIHKIEHENNQLQVRAKNHKVLRQHLASLLARYSISRATREVVIDFDSVHADSPEDQASKLATAARELMLASQGRSHMKAANPDQLVTPLSNADLLPEEPFLLAVKEKRAELEEMCHHFLQRCYAFLESKIATCLSNFRESALQNLQSPTDFLPSLGQTEQLSHHASLTALKDLFQAVSQMGGRNSQQALAELYVRAGGLAYGDLFGALFNSLFGLVVRSETNQSAMFRLASIFPATGVDAEQEIRNAEVLASSIINTSQVSPSIALSHALREISPLIVQEELFLRSVLLKDSDIDYSKVLSVLFQDTANVSKALFGILDQAQGDISQVLVMIVEIETQAATFGSKSQFLQGLLSQEKHSLDSTLCTAYFRFIEEEIRWIDTCKVPASKVAGILVPVPKVVRLVDNILALWNAIVRDEQYDINSPTFASSVVGRGLIKLLEHALTWIEQVASSQKSGEPELVRYENLLFLSETMSQRRIGKALHPVVKDTQQKASQALGRYVRGLIAGPFHAMITFIDDTEALLEQGTPMSEVIYHKSRIELGKVMQDLSEMHIKQAFAGLCVKIRSSLDPQDPLLKEVYDALQVTFNAKYHRFVHILQECYGDLVTPSPEQVEKLTEVLCNPTNTGTLNF